MKKWFLAILLLPVFVYSAGLKPDPSVTPEMRDEGDSPLFLNVACPPLGGNGWASVVSSDTIRRSLFITTDYASAPPPICLGTAAILSTAIQCSTSFQGIVLNSNTIQSITIYTKNAWTCASATAVTGTLHGYIGRDKRDYGWINSNALQ